LSKIEYARGAMSDFRAITVPCLSCKADVGFPGRVCPKCNTPLSRDRRDALTTRLASASEEFRDLLSNEQRASTILLILALSHVVFGAVICLLQMTGDVLDASDRVEAIDLFMVNLAIGAALFGCYVWSKRAAVPAIAVAIVLWLGVHIFASATSPLLPELVGATPFVVMREISSRALVLILLLRGLFSSLKAARIRRTLDQGSGVPAL
jgi:hypothetical protein